ncbi:MAG: hypothetical protein ACPGVB_01050 [Chitinophagales bacterium]
MKHIKNLLFIFLVTLILSACSKSKLQHAQESLVGNWTVTKSYLPTPANGETQQQTGKLGTFRFGEKEVTYSFENNGKTYKGTSPWQLTMKKVHSGFINVPEYTLQLKDNLQFIATFGDQTSDATVRATKAELSKKDNSGEIPKIQLWLEKD